MSTVLECKECGNARIFVMELKPVNRAVHYHDKDYENNTTRYWCPDCEAIVRVARATDGKEVPDGE